MNDISRESRLGPSRVYSCRENRGREGIRRRGGKVDSDHDIRATRKGFYVWGDKPEESDRKARIIGREF